MSTIRSYVAVPKRVNLVSTRSKSPYWDRLVVTTELRKVVPGVPGGEIIGGLSRGAFLGFCGKGGSVELTNAMVADGVHTDWEFPLSLDLKPEQSLELHVEVYNSRGMPDERWLGFLIALGGVAALGTSLYIDAQKTLSALERVNTEINKNPALSSLVDSVLDAYISLWDDPAKCAGLVFQGSLVLDPAKLDFYKAAPGIGASLPDGAYSDVIRLRIEPTPVGSKEGCGNPSAFVDVEVHRKVQLLFDPVSMTVKVSAVRERPPDPSNLRGWVDEADTLTGVNPPVHVKITREEANVDLFHVKVVERVGEDVLISEEFSDVQMRLRQCSSPVKPKFAKRTPGAHPDGFAVGGDELVHLPDTRDLTYSMPLRSGDYGTSEIVFWRRTYLDNNGHVLKSEVQMFYTRSDYKDLSDTATWLGEWADVG